MGTKETKILAVDDDPRNLRIIEEIFEDEYALYTAINGQDALDKVASVKPDVVLLDIMMPEMDGLEVCRRLRADDKYSAIKIVLVSARAMPDERSAGYAAGADQYITKPFDHNELVEIVDTMKSCI